MSSFSLGNDNLLKIFYSPNKHGRRINNTNIIRTTQLQSRQKHLKLDSNLDTRLARNTLGKAKPKYSWQYFTISIFLDMKSFMKNLLITKSRDCRSDLVKGHTSRPYSSAGKHLTLINWKVAPSEATRPIFAKTRMLTHWMVYMTLDWHQDSKSGPKVHTSIASLGVRASLYVRV